MRSALKVIQVGYRGRVKLKIAYTITLPQLYNYKAFIEDRGRSYVRVLDSSLITLIWLSLGAPHDRLKLATINLNFDVRRNSNCYIRRL